MLALSKKFMRTSENGGIGANFMDYQSTVKKTAGALFLLLLLLMTYLSLTPAAPSVATYTWDKLNHACAYLCLGILLDMGFLNGWKIPLKLLPLFGYSIVMELLQYFIPTRHFSGLDIVANSAGLLLAALVILALRQTRLYPSPD